MQRAPAGCGSEGLPRTGARWRATCLTDTVHVWLQIPLRINVRIVNTLNCRGVAAALLLAPLVFGCVSPRPPETATPVPPIVTAVPAPAAAMPADHQHHMT